MSAGIISLGDPIWRGWGAARRRSGEVPGRWDCCSVSMIFMFAARLDRGFGIADEIASGGVVENRMMEVRRVLGEDRRLLAGSPERTTPFVGPGFAPDPCLWSLPPRRFGSLWKRFPEWDASFCLTVTCRSSSIPVRELGCGAIGSSNLFSFIRTRLIRADVPRTLCGLVGLTGPAV